MPETVDVQVQGQAVFLQNQLEPPGEGAGSHGQVSTMAAEDQTPSGEGEQARPEKPGTALPWLGQGLAGQSDPIPDSAVLLGDQGRLGAAL